jgi:hypothetical protein
MPLDSTFKAAFHEEKNKYKDFALKPLANSEECCKNRIQISILDSFPAIGQFSPVISPFRMQEKSAKIYISPAAFGTIFRNFQPVFGIIV